MSVAMLRATTPASLAGPISPIPTGGFLGLPGNEARVDMRVVDVYRREGDKLAENWALIDLPYWLKQQDLDILERNRELKGPDLQFLCTTPLFD
jgi:hypothetical protein